MRLLIPAAIAISCGFATAANTTRASVLSSGTICADLCTNGQLFRSPCLPTQQNCLCSDNEWWTRYVQPCILTRCTLNEGLAALNQTTTVCEWPVPNRAATILNTIGWFAGFASVLVIVRLLTKAIKLSKWGIDDTTIVLAWVMFTCFLPAAIIAIRSGFASDMWSVPSRSITRFLFYFFLLEPFYYTVVFLIKASILFTYMRIFQNQRARKLFQATHAFNLFQAVVFIVLSFAQCQPLSHFWLGWTGQDPDGHCFNLSVLPVTHAVLGVALDLWMIALPASQVLALKMQLKDTIEALLMFGCGVFLTAVSCMRIPYLLTFAKTSNLTIDSLQTGVWTYMEVGAGIMVACLPNLRQLYTQLILPKLRRTPSLSRGARSGPRFTLRTRTHVESCSTPNPQSHVEMGTRHSAGSGASSQDFKPNDDAGGKEWGSKDRARGVSYVKTHRPKPPLENRDSNVSIGDFELVDLHDSAAKSKKEPYAQSRD